MSDKVIIYNEEHITNIENKYKECIEDLQSAIAYNNSAKEYMMNNYDGQAKEMVEEIFGKIEAHLKLLSACCETTKTYVKDSLETIEQVDSGYAKSSERG